MENWLKMLIAATCAAVLIAIGYLAWGEWRRMNPPLTERQKAEQAFRAAQDRNEDQMRARCKEPFGTGLSEREEMNRKWCINHGLLDPF